MTWSRTFIFYGSDIGKRVMKQMGYQGNITSVIPALCLSGMAQCINNPIFRATIILQNPKCTMKNAPEALTYLFKKGGPRALWHGTSAGIMKTAPKYASAVLVKDVIEEFFIKSEERKINVKKQNQIRNQNVDKSQYKNVDKNEYGTEDPKTIIFFEPKNLKEKQNQDEINGIYERGEERIQRLQRASIKSIAAGLAGAMITNPFDVIRADMFKSDRTFSKAVRQLWKEHGIFFIVRGLDKNMVAVTVPVTITLFIADTLENI